MDKIFRSGEDRTTFRAPPLCVHPAKAGMGPDATWGLRMPLQPAEH